MFSQCSECKTHYRLNADELRIGQGHVKCTKCGTIFNALNSLGESLGSTGFDDYNAIPELEEHHVVHFYSLDQPVSTDQTLASWKETAPRTPFQIRFFWASSIFCLCLLLGTQFIYYRGGKLLEDKSINTWLVKTCQLLNCEPPMYRNVALIDVLDHTLYRKSERILEFQISVANNAEFTQPFPPIQLTLMAFNGDTMAKRVFQPDQYLSGNLVDTLMPLHHPLKINLQILNPGRKIGGYQFKLI